MLASFRNVISELHPEKVVHAGSESLFDAQGHFRRERGLTGEKVRERASANRYTSVTC